MRRSPLIASVAVALGLMVFAFGIVFPRGREVQEINGRIAEAETGLAQVEAQLSVLQAVDGAAIARDLAAIRALIPSSAALPELLRSLDRVGRGAGVLVTSISVGPGTPSTAASVTVLPITLSVQGGYFEVARFLFELEHLDRLTLVRGVSLSPGAERRLTASISAEVYTTDTSVGPGAGAEPGPEVGA